MLETSEHTRQEGSQYLMRIMISVMNQPHLQLLEHPLHLLAWNYTLRSFDVCAVPLSILPNIDHVKLGSLPHVDD